MTSEFSQMQIKKYRKQSPWDSGDVPVSQGRPTRWTGRTQRSTLPWNGCVSHRGELTVLKPLHTDAGQGVGMKKYRAWEGGQGTRPTWAGASGVPAAGQAGGTKGSVGVGVGMEPRSWILNTILH